MAVAGYEDGAIAVEDDGGSESALTQMYQSAMPYKAGSWRDVVVKCNV